MAKRVLQPLASQGVNLRPLEEADLPLTRDWRNQEHIRRWFNFTGIVTGQMHEQWWRDYQEKDDDFVFMIEQGPPWQRAGQVSLYAINEERRSAEYGRCIIGPEGSGKNLLYRASLLLFKVARQQLGLEHLYLQVKADNAKAIHIYRKLGFAAVKEDAGLLWMGRCLPPEQSAGSAADATAGH